MVRSLKGEGLAVKAGGLGASSDSFLKISWKYLNVGYRHICGICGERSLHSGNIAGSWSMAMKKESIFAAEPSQTLSC